MKQFLSMVCLLCISTADKAETGPFFSAEPSNTPALLAPQLLLTPLTAYNGSFNPTGTEFVYTVNIPGEVRGFQGVIVYTRMQPNGDWSAPAIAPFSGQHSDYDPLFSPDGQRLYFSSRRPLPDAPESIRNNVWFVQKQDHGWDPPTHVKLTGKGDVYNSLTRTGDLYFNTWSSGEMWVAKPFNDQYRVEKLPPPLNSAGNYDGDPFISPKGDYLIFRRDRGQDTLGRGDLFITFNINGQWTAPENLGAPINSPDHEMCPAVTADGGMLIFSSNRKLQNYPLSINTPVTQLTHKFTSADNGQQNLYQVSADFIEKLRNKHMK